MGSGARAGQPRSWYFETVPADRVLRFHRTIASNSGWLWRRPERRRSSSPTRTASTSRPTRARRMRLRSLNVFSPRAEAHVLLDFETATARGLVEMGARHGWTVVDAASAMGRPHGMVRRGSDSFQRGRRRRDGRPGRSRHSDGDGCCSIASSSCSRFCRFTYLVFWGLSTSSQRYVWLTVTGYVFYGYWNPKFTLLWRFNAGQLHGRPGLSPLDRRSTASAMLVIPIATDLALLGFFKYTNFLLDSAHSALHRAWYRRTGPPFSTSFCPSGSRSTPSTPSPTSSTPTAARSVRRAISSSSLPTSRCSRSWWQARSSGFDKSRKTSSASARRNARDGGLAAWRSS